MSDPVAAVNYAAVILRLIEVLVPALQRSSVSFDALRTMVDEGREPSAEEWDALFAELRAHGDRLERAVERLEGSAALLVDAVGFTVER